jgi:hypothetical protein
MSDHPSDYSWHKRLAKFCEVTGKTPARCWTLAGETSAFDIHEWLDMAEKGLTVTQRRELKKP